MANFGAIVSNAIISLASDILDNFSIRKLADQTVSKTILTDDNNLTISLAASSSYYFCFILFFTNIGALEGFKIDVN